MHLNQNKMLKKKGGGSVRFHTSLLCSPERAKKNPFFSFDLISFKVHGNKVRERDETRQRLLMEVDGVHDVVQIHIYD